MMTNEEAKQIKVGDSIRIGELITTVEEIKNQFGDTFFSTEYGDFNVSVCEKTND